MSGGTERLRELVEKWRQNSKGISGNSNFVKGMDHQAGICAEELEAALADSPATNAINEFLAEVRPLTPEEHEALGRFYKKVYKPVESAAPVPSTVVEPTAVGDSMAIASDGLIVGLLQLEVRHYHDAAWVRVNDVIAAFTKQNRALAKNEEAALADSVVTDVHKEPKTGCASGQDHVRMPRVSIPESAAPADALNPSLTLLCKLGSIAVHAQELFEPKGHEFDREALLSVLSDEEVQRWIKEMGVYMPVKR